MESKKVGTISLYGFVNYGNYLQNYAVHKIWKTLGYDPVLLSFRDGGSLEFLKLQARAAVRRVLWVLPNRRKRFWIRFFAIKKFTESTMHARTVRLGGVDKLADEFCCFSVGSDQIWNPNYTKQYRGKGICFLSFARRSQRVCMVPSFGISQLPQEAKTEFEAGLAGFDRFNVREEAGARIIKELTGKDAEVLVDPTMALTRDEWELFARQTGRYDNKRNYILLYFLGEISAGARKAIESLARQRRLEVVDMLDPADESYTALPPDFVRLISNADLICTDSFHASVFSIIFNRPFVMFDRNSGANEINSRSSTLLGRFSLEERKSDNIRWDDSAFRCRYEQADEILAVERQRLLDSITRQLVPRKD